MSWMDDAKTFFADAGTEDRLLGMYNKLVDMCVDVFAYSELDYEITLAGNGVSAFECSAMAKATLDILGLKYVDIQTRVDHRIRELEEMYG